MLRVATALVLMLGLASTAMAQDYAIDRGAFLLDGMVSFTNQGGELYENVDGDRLNRLLVNPRALYFVSPGFAIGGDVLVERVSQGDASATTLGIGPEIAYFFGDSESTFYPYVSGGVGYVNFSSEGFDASGFGFSFGVGGAVLLTRAVAIMIQGDYAIDNLSVDQADESFSGNTFRLQMGVGAFLF